MPGKERASRETRFAVGRVVQANGSNLTSVTIGGGVTSIGDWAFSFCTCLTSVTIGNSVWIILDYAFAYCTNVTNVTIPDSVIDIQDWVFSGCTNLIGVYYQGNAPRVDGRVFDGAPKAVVYYLPGTTGWGTTFASRLAVLWNPQVQTRDESFGVRTNQFRFTITGTAGIPIVVEASTDLVSATWVPLQSCTLTNGSSYFSDPDWTNYPARFYRLRSP